MGLDVLLPNVANVNARANATWTFEMDMSKRHWEYRGDRKLLGFDPTQRMMYIGRANGLDDSWLTWAPRYVVGANVNLDAVEQSGGTTRMDPTDFRIGAAMLAWMMEKMHYSNVYVVGGYPDVSSDARFNTACDIL